MEATDARLRRKEATGVPLPMMSWTLSKYGTLYSADESRGKEMLD